MKSGQAIHKEIENVRRTILARGGQMGMWTVLRDKRLVDIPALCCDVCGDTFLGIIRRGHHLMRLVKAGMDEQHASSFDSCTATAFADRMEKERLSAVTGQARTQSVGQARILLNQLYEKPEVKTVENMGVIENTNLILTHTEFWNRRNDRVSAENLAWGKRYCHDPFVCTECYNDPRKMYADLDQTFNDVIHARRVEERYRNYVMAMNVVKQRRFSTMRQPVSVDKDMEYTVFGYVDPFAFKEEYVQADRPALYLPMDKDRYVSAYIIEPYFVKVDEVDDDEDEEEEEEDDGDDDDDDGDGDGDDDRDPGHKRSRTLTEVKASGVTPAHSDQPKGSRQKRPRSSDGSSFEAKRGRAASKVKDSRDDSGPSERDDKAIVSYEDFCSSIVRNANNEDGLGFYFQGDAIACVDVCVRGFSVSLVDQQPHQAFTPSELVCGPHCGFGPWRIPAGTPVVCESHPGVAGHLGIVTGMKRIGEAVTFELDIVNYPSEKHRGMARVNTLKLGLTPIKMERKRIHDERLTIENFLPTQDARYLDEWHDLRQDGVATFLDRAIRPLHLNLESAMANLEHSSFAIVNNLYDINFAGARSLIFSSTLLCEFSYNPANDQIEFYGLEGRFGFRQKLHVVESRIQRHFRRLLATNSITLKTQRIYYFLVHVRDDDIEACVRSLIRTHKEVSTGAHLMEEGFDDTKFEIILNTKSKQTFLLNYKPTDDKVEQYFRYFGEQSQSDFTAWVLPDDEMTEMKRLWTKIHGRFIDASTEVSDSLSLVDSSMMDDETGKRHLRAVLSDDRAYETMIGLIVQRLQSVSSAMFRRDLDRLHDYLLSRRLNTTLFDVRPGGTKQVIERNVVFETDVVRTSNADRISDPLLALQQDLLGQDIQTTVQNAANYLFAKQCLMNMKVHDSTGSRTVDSLIKTVLKLGGAISAARNFDRSDVTWPLIERSFIAVEFCLCTRDPRQKRVLSRLLTPTLAQLSQSEDADVKSVLAEFKTVADKHQPALRSGAEDSTTPFKDDRMYWLRAYLTAADRSKQEVAKTFFDAFLDNSHVSVSAYGPCPQELVQIIMIAAAACQGDEKQFVNVVYAPRAPVDSPAKISWADRATKALDQTEKTITVTDMPNVVKSLISLIRGGDSSAPHQLRWSVASQLPIVTQIMREIVKDQTQSTYTFSGDVASSIMGAIVYDELTLHQPSVTVGTAIAFVRGWKACTFAGSIKRASDIQDILLIRISDMFGKASQDSVWRHMGDAIDRNMLGKTLCRSAELSRVRSKSLLLPSMSLIGTVAIHIYPSPQSKSVIFRNILFTSERCSSLANVYELRRRLLDHYTKLQSRSKPTALLTYALMFRECSVDVLSDAVQYLSITGIEPDYDGDIVSVVRNLSAEYKVIKK